MSAQKICANCRNPPPRREFLRCMNCNNIYDLHCANVSLKLFNLMERKEQWTCKTCVTKGQKLASKNAPGTSSTMLTVSPVPTTSGYETPVFVTPEANSEGEDISNITQRNKHVTFTSPYTVQPGTTTQPSNTENAMIMDLKRFMAELIRTEVNTVCQGITNLTNIVKDQNTRIDQLELRMTTLETEATEKPTHADTTALKEQIMQLKADISDRDQTLLSNDIEIAGCPEALNENVTHLVLSISRKIGIDLEERDIVNVYRAGPVRPAAVAPPASLNGTGGTTDSNDGGAAGGKHAAAALRPRPLVVSLARRTLRDAVLRAARVRRNVTTEGLQLGGADQAHKIYINERLTKHNRLLFQRARTLAREKNFRYVWTRDGKIFVCQDAGKVRYRLRTEDDLARVFT